MSDKYNERVRAIATEMAVSHYLKHPEERAMKFIGVAFSQLPKGEQAKLIELKMSDARITVKHMADGIRAYAIKCAALPADDTYTVEQFLKEQGLIPDSAQEGKRTVFLECMVCGSQFEGPVPEMCCSGRDCGCMGMPVDPVVCSQECYNNLPHVKNRQQPEGGKQ